MNVMRRLGKDSLTIAIIMDLQDWFPNTVDSPPSGDSKPCELTETIRTLRNALKTGGRVFFRSAGQEPWYLELYRREGFRVECIHKRPIGGKEPIDRVNMYVPFCPESAVAARLTNLPSSPPEQVRLLLLLPQNLVRAGRGRGVWNSV